MEYEINREKFLNENFEAKEYVNNLLKGKKENESSDILSFKLKIIQREFANEIELNSNNVLKSAKTIRNDLKLVNQLNGTILQKVGEVIKGQTASFNSKTPKEYIVGNMNIDKAIKVLEK